ncbi:hypothetical protein CWI37_0408p0030 [Hamiltosporidium tvaerminnensis]|uniref:Uncharacterized protein n=1 Tax=Hamiltosporidium tvaerminnensis TaxID=1176355 RepID=A0A4Q9L5P9_9MICR|nr:hypothetical protein LUQ84_000375 [Hamiltosporidium tvaerminnensis]TBU02824.1 hypothetical protein CWI37_0408p0030 [Hamiltosporidium tvaerminnensis]
MLYYMLLVSIKSTETGPQRDMNCMRNNISTEEMLGSQSIQQIEEEIIFFYCSKEELTAFDAKSNSNSSGIDKEVIENMDPSEIKRSCLFISSLDSIKRNSALNPEIPLINIISLIEKKRDTDKSNQNQE